MIGLRLTAIAEEAVEKFLTSNNRELNIRELNISGILTSTTRAIAGPSLGLGLVRMLC